MENKEIWKPIIESNGDYYVSNYGRVRSTERISKNNHLIPEKILAIRKDKDGYCIATIYISGKRVDRKIHRLVADAFIPNPNNYPMINHKDETRDNNYVDNLEWCDAKYNANYGTCRQRQSIAMRGRSREYMKGDKNYFHTHFYRRGKHPQAKKVNQYDLDGNLIAVFLCLEDAAEAVGCTNGAISMACQGKRDKIKGFRWSYAE